MVKKPAHTARALSPSRATEHIRKIARNKGFGMQLTQHAKDRMAERDLIMGDILHVLRNGFVYSDGEAATREGLYKYKMENKSPNSASREVRVVVIPSPTAAQAKIVTVMWVDETD